MTLTPQEQRDLIVAALPSATDASTNAPQPSRLFAPSGHRSALDPAVTLVRGGRGVGKTVWFLSLQQKSLRELAAKEYRLPSLAELEVHPGYGSLLEPRYPGPGMIGRLLAEGRSEHVWQAVCMHALSDPDPNVAPDWIDLVRNLGTQPDLFETFIGNFDRLNTGRTHLIVFDALDRMSSDPEITNDLTIGLLKTALELRTRTRHIRAKVFARPDLLPHRLPFADSSKLIAGEVELRWSPTNLYGLLFTLMANAEHEAAKDFRSDGDWHQIAADVWRDANLAGDASRQIPVWATLASPFMGTNKKRGRTYAWLPTHLADGLQQASPRSFLSALRTAADDSIQERSGHAQALHWESIRVGVQAASKIRVNEIREDIPWMERVFEPLDRMAVPAPESDVLSRWEGANNLEPSLGDDDSEVRVGPRRWGGPELIEELAQLGVMTRRRDGRIDVPDVYRLAFGITRKGGVPRMV